jgi:hypothetical protein
MKKTYEIEYRRTSYIIIWVDAETAEEADEKAWAQVEEDYDINDALWEIYSIDGVLVEEKANESL